MSLYSDVNIGTKPSSNKIVKTSGVVFDLFNPSALWSTETNLVFANVFLCTL